MKIDDIECRSVQDGVSTVSLVLLFRERLNKCFQLFEIFHHCAICFDFCNDMVISVLWFDGRTHQQDMLLPQFRWSGKRFSQVAYWDTFDGQAIRVLEGSEEGEITTLSVSQLGSEISWWRCMRIGRMVVLGFPLVPEKKEKPETRWYLIKSQFFFCWEDDSCLGPQVGGSEKTG